MMQVGKDFRADGVEISAHALCAEDHLPYQGLQFTRKQFEDIQTFLPRPICQWNCKHTVFPIRFGISRPAHSDEELTAYKQNSEERIEIGGVTRTRYQWTQEQRRIETAVRQRKNVAVAAKASGDDALRREAQAEINRLKGIHGEIGRGIRVEAEPERMTVSGFRGGKTVEQLKTSPQLEELNASPQSAIMPVSTKAAGGDGVQFVCKIDRDIYSCVTKDITTDEVVITDERIEHITGNHPGDFEQYREYISQMLETPDFILEDKPNTALVLKTFISADDTGTETYLRLILRLHTSKDNPEYKNSVLTFMKTNAKKWKQNINNKKVLYRRND